MELCRSCGKDETENLGFVGSIAPFFLKRVLNLEVGMAAASHPVKKLLRRIPLAADAFQKVYGSAVFTEMEICRSCTFVQTRTAFSDEAIGRLYSDYRSDSYNLERIRYEPAYAAIARDVGNCPQEIEARNGGLTRWLASRITPEAGFSMLDYGGADGKFLPDLNADKYVFEISNIAPVPGVTRIEKQSDLGRYSYVQLAHVLEHVTNPLLLTKQAASRLKSGGYLYIEVPVEISDHDLNRLLAGDRNISLVVHEHINRFSMRSMTELLKAANLIPIAVETAQHDIGWAKGTIIRALAQPPA